LTVTALTAQMQRLFTREYGDVRVAGEISGFKVWTSGHAYFTLKDAGAQIRCVLFRGAMRYLRFRPADGLAVVARGSVEIRAERGEYQLIVTGLEPQGYGALQLAFEQLKQRLAEEGLFAAERKRPLPRFPRRIGIVTSPKGAVIRDMISVLRRRWPAIEVRLYPAQVQGQGAAAEVCAGLDYFSRTAWADVVIVGRGGGSLEDLWTFNEESVARAIAACATPVISAVGHETDFTIADFVADLRAPTPSAAAELLVPDRADLGSQLRRLRQRLQLHQAQLERRLGQRLDQLELRLRAQAPALRLQRVRTRLQQAAARLMQSQRRSEAERRRSLQQLRLRLQRATPAQRLRREREQGAELLRRLRGGVSQNLQRQRLRSGLLARTLSAVSPLATLGRGYAILLDADSGSVVARASEARQGQALRARLVDGELKLRCE